jgi:hypothetical protein
MISTNTYSDHVKFARSNLNDLLRRQVCNILTYKIM